MSNTQLEDQEKDREKKEETIRVISEKMTEMRSLLDEMGVKGSVDKNTALGLEQIHPGIITEVAHLNSFTQQPSRINFDVVYNRINLTLESLSIEKDTISKQLETTRTIHL